MLVVDSADCKQVYKTMYNIPINKYHICAGPITEGGSGTCIVISTIDILKIKIQIILKENKYASEFVTG